MTNEEWDTKIMAPFDQFLHMSFRKFDKLFDSMMTIKCLAAQKVCDEHTLVNCSTQNSPDPDSAAEQSDGGDGDSEPESQPPKKKKAPATSKLSEYEIIKAANTARNKVLAKQLDEKFRMDYGPFVPELEVGALKPAQKKREKKQTDQVALRRSARTNEEM